MTGRAAEELADARGLVRPLVVSLVASGTSMVALAVALFFYDPSSAGPETVVFVVLLLLPAVVIGAAGLLWLRWFTALYRVTREVGRARHGRVMAWLGWIVPIVVLVVPKRLVDDVWRAGGDRSRLPLAVRAWWALWFASHALRVGHRLPWPADLPWWVDPAGYFLLVLATPFAVATVYALTDRLEEVTGPAASTDAVPPEPGYAKASPT